MRRLVLVCLTAISLLALTGSAQAQIDEEKFEIGAVFTSITLSDFRSRSQPGFATGDATVRGLGGRLAYNFTDYLAIDGEASFFPETKFGNDEFAQKMQGFVGVKAGVRRERVGVFAKARPGVMWFGEFSSRGGCSTTGFGRVCGVSHEKDFALDLGGVVEFYPSTRSIIRFDVGDTLIRYPERRLGTIGTPVILNGGVKNNFQWSVGVGWRF
jgi:hypothetical protein